MILLLDHDDSFVHTLAAYLAVLGAEPVVRRDAAITLGEIVAMRPAGIVLSPGPGTPEECALGVAVVQTLGAATPILGVCLGHQVIAHAFGATVARASHPRHGRTSRIHHDGEAIVPAGGGITALSQPEAEHREAVTKAAALLAALEAAG